MPDAAKYMMAAGSVTLVAGFIIWFRLHRLPNIQWGGFDWYGLFICIACAAMTAATIVHATRS
jgi:hypothetical protein